MTWNDLTEQEKMVWAAAFAAGHNQFSETPRVWDYHITRQRYEQCELLADHCVDDLRALKSRRDRLT